MAPGYYSETMHQLLFMAPSLLISGTDRFKEQQRLRASAELYLTLSASCLVLVTGVLANMTLPWLLALVAVLGSLALCAAFAVLGAMSWVDSNSQIAHALVDSNRETFLNESNWDVGRISRRSLPRWLGSLAVR